jgi:hypothetical protein
MENYKISFWWQMANFDYGQVNGRRAGEGQQAAHRSPPCQCSLNHANSGILGRAEQAWLPCMESWLAGVGQGSGRAELGGQLEEEHGQKKAFSSPGQR